MKALEVRTMGPAVRLGRSDGQIPANRRSKVRTLTVSATPTNRGQV